MSFLSINEQEYMVYSARGCNVRHRSYIHAVVGEVRIHDFYEVVIVQLYTTVDR